LHLIEKKIGGEQTFYSAPPDDAPESIKRRFAELNLTPLDPEVEQEKRVQENYRIAAQHKAERIRERAISLTGK